LQGGAGLSRCPERVILQISCSALLKSSGHVRLVSGVLHDCAKERYASSRVSPGEDQLHPSAACAADRANEREARMLIKPAMLLLTRYSFRFADP